MVYTNAQSQRLRDDPLLRVVVPKPGNGILGVGPLLENPAPDQRLGSVCGFGRGLTENQSRAFKRWQELEQLLFALSAMRREPELFDVQRDRCEFGWNEDGVVTRGEAAHSADVWPD
ncbi:hypothetical protein D3C80_1104800 [compost metagenome]